MRQVHHIIGGEYVRGASERFTKIFNPNTGEVQAKVELASQEDVAKAIADVPLGM